MFFIYWFANVVAICGCDVVVHIVICYLLFLSVRFRSLLMSCVFFFLMIRRPPRSTLDRSSAASDVYKRQAETMAVVAGTQSSTQALANVAAAGVALGNQVQRLVTAGAKNVLLTGVFNLSLIHISEPTRPY